MKMDKFIKEMENKKTNCDFNCSNCDMKQEEDCILREPESWTIEFKPNKYAEIQKTLGYSTNSLFQINNDTTEDDKTEKILLVILVLIALVTIVLCGVLIFMTIQLGYWWNS